MGAIFAIGVVSFLGTLSLGHQGLRFRQFESAEVRTALTTSFAMVFFAAVGIFLFSANTVGDFGRTLMSNLTSLFGVVIGFYFASSAVVEYGRIRAAKGAEAGSGQSFRPEEPKPVESRLAEESDPQVEPSALEAKIAELEATVARLAAAMATPDGREKRPTTAEPSVSGPPALRVSPAPTRAEAGPTGLTSSNTFAEPTGDDQRLAAGRLRPVKDLCGLAGGP